MDYKKIFGLDEEDSSVSIRYGGITYGLSLFIFVAVFVEPQDKLVKKIFDFIYNLVALSVFWFGFLWQRRQTLLLALFVAVFSWNIDIIIFPLIQTKNEMIVSSNLFTYDKILHILAYFLFITGLFKWINLTNLKSIMKIEIETLFISLLGFSVIFQLLFRL